MYLQLYPNTTFLTSHSCAYLDPHGKFGFRAQKINVGLGLQIEARLQLCDLPRKDIGRYTAQNIWSNIQPKIFGVSWCLSLIPVPLNLY